MSLGIKNKHLPAKLSRRRTINKDTENVYVHFSCPTYDLHLSGSCKNKVTPEKKLKEMVFEAIKVQISLLFELREEAEKITSSPKIKNHERELRSEMQSIGQRLSKLKSLRGSLYEDFANNVLSEQEYMYNRGKFETESVELTSRSEKISAEIEALEKRSAESIADNEYVAEMRRFDVASELSREMLNSLVEKIVIHHKNKIEVVFKYRDEFAELEKYVEENES